MKQILPSPPSDHEKYLYVDQNKSFLYSFSLVSTILLTTGGVLFTIGHPEMYWYLAFVGMTLFYLIIGFVVGMFSKPFDLSRHYDIIRSKSFLPTVDVYLPTCGEPIDVLENTMAHISNLDYPNFTVYVLDDSNRKEVKLLADRYKFFYVVRKNRPELKKSGNVRNAFSFTEGELILILDADFCPRADFLHETVPYFQLSRLAILQTPQFFRVHKEQNFIEKGAASVQELFYRLIQVNRNHYGAAMCVGTCALYRRKALEPLGGTYPITDSEDANTGMWLFKNGWKVSYLPINLAAGLCPDTMESFFSQQSRWATGATSLFLSKDRFWAAKMTLMQRLSFISGMLYYQATALGLLFIPIPSIVMVWFYPENIYWYNLAFAAPSFLFSLIHMKLWSKQDYGLHVLKVRAVSYYAHAMAIWGVLTNNVMAWIPTGESGAAARNKRVIWFKRLMLGWSIIVPVVILSGVAFNAESWQDVKFYPQVIVTLFYSYINLGCFKKEAM